MMKYVLIIADASGNEVSMIFSYQPIFGSF